jgi:peptidoglycan/LPS O-acetylase OafA/YrhL
MLRVGKVLQSVESKNDYFLELMRGIAILGVLFYHANAELFPQGYLGVDIFFVLSGWLLAPRLLQILGVGRRATISVYLAFVNRRLKRLLPALRASMLLTLPCVILTLNVGRDLERSLLQGIAGVFGFANFTAPTLAGDYFSPGPNPYLHLWSLSAEFQIYLISPIILILTSFAAHSIVKILRPMPLLFNLIQVFSIFTIIYLSHSFYNHYSTLFRGCQFLIGLACYMYSQELRHRSNTAWYQLVFYFLSIAAVILGSTSLTPSGQLSLIASSLSGMSLFTYGVYQAHFLKVYEKISGTIIVRGILYFARISYPAYLIHYPLFVIAKHSNVLNIEAIDNRIFQTLVAFGVTILLSEYVHLRHEYSKQVSFGSSTSQDMVSKRNLFSYYSVLALLVISLFLNAKQWFGFNNHDAIPTKIGSKPFLGCDFELSIDQIPCEINRKDSNKRIALIGDSHAVVLSEVVSDFALENDLQLDNWATTGCKYVDTSLLKQSFKTEDPCLIRNTLFREKVATGYYSAVVAASRSQNCKFNEFLGYCGERFTRLQLESLRNLQISPKRVLFIGPTFEIMEEVNYFHERALLSKFVLPREFYSYTFLDPQPNKDLLIYKENYLNYFSPIEIFCSRSRCQVTLEDGEYVLSDTNHLSREGARILGVAARPKLLSLLEQ